MSSSSSPYVAALDGEPFNYQRLAVDAEGKLLAKAIIDGAVALRLHDASSTVTYIGKAVAGAVDSAALWQIQRITTTSSTLKIEFADGDSSFDNVWDDRAGLVYS